MMHFTNYSDDELRTLLDNSTTQLGVVTMIAREFSERLITAREISDELARCLDEHECRHCGSGT